MTKMKFYANCLLAIMVLSFSACSNDEEENVGSTSDLIGTWEIVSYTYQWKEDGKVVEEGIDNENDERITFYEDGTFEGAEYYDGKWNRSEQGTWSYKNGRITVWGTYEGGSSESVTVKELTSSKLVVEYIDKYTEDGISYEDYGLTEYRKISD